MYNTDMPTRAELPTSRQLLRSTVIALGTATVLLVTIVLPAEYAIDPTGIGRALGLTDMGEIKGQLAREAETDRLRDQSTAPAAAAPAPERRSGVLGRVFAALVVGSAHAQAAPAKPDEMSMTLAPGEGVEVKMTMRAGAKATYAWAAASGELNYDLHGSPAGGGSEKSYKRGRGEKGDQGVVTAGFDGAHGWFWRNRSRAPVTVTLKVSGDYTDLKRMK